MLKKISKIFRIVCLVIFGLFILTSCEIVYDLNHDQTSDVEITEYLIKSMPFEDQTFLYDGNPHSIYMDNIYESQGVTITYANNNHTEPGSYNVVATIQFEKIKVTKIATLTIDKFESVLDAEAAQTMNLKNNELEIKYSINNDVQKDLVILNEQGEEIEIEDIATPGVYNLEIYVKETSYYKESNHVSIVVNVVESLFEVNFVSKKVIADGNEHEIKLEGELPSGYTVEYNNNKGSVDGKYYATASILDENHEVVEVHGAVLIIDNPENEEFKQYLDDFFVTYLEDDQLSVNIFCENPEKFGLSHYEASWYTFTPFDDDAIAHDLQLFKDLLAELEVFKEQPLNDLQETAYRTVEKFLQYYVDYYSIEDALFMEVLYVDQFGGYVADFGTYMESYSLRGEAEVKDIVDYIESTKEAFPSYLDFLQAKVEHGYPLSDFTITEMKNYLVDVLAQGENYYLKDILFEKIDAVGFLSEEQKASYKDQVAAAIKDCFVVGVQALHDGLDNYLGLLDEANEGYLTQYEKGKDLYILDLEKTLGYENLDVESYVKTLDTELKSSIVKVITAQSAIVREFGITTYAELDALVKEYSIFEGTPEEMMVYLKEFAKTIVPDLQSDPDIVIKNMDLASAKVSNAVAYYMKSALDNTGSEYITLNPVQLGMATPNDVISTLAHEGYPGHLYAYVYSKELGLSNLATIMTSVGHAEGWATYVELQLYQYAKANSTDKKFHLIMDYLYANQLSGFLLETRLDAGIQLEGWGIEEVAECMDSLGYSADSAEYIYDLLIEIPGQYASYGYGKYIFNKLHEEAKAILGIYYDEVEFNAMLLSKGWTDLQILEETYEEYMLIKCHECGLQFR